MTAPTSDAVLELAKVYPAFAKRAFTIVSKVPGEGRIPFVFNRMQRRFWRQFINSRKLRHVVLKARQMGQTTVLLGFELMCALLIPGFSVFVGSLTGDLDKKISAHLLALYDSMPKDLQRELAPVKRRGDDGLTFANGSSIFVHTQGGFTASRGQMFHFVHITEYSMWTNPEATIATILGALAPTGIAVYESTSNGFNHWFALVEEAQQPGSIYEFFFAGWFEAEEYALPVTEPFEATYEESMLMAEYGLTPEQILFRRFKMADVRTKFPQEYPATPTESFIAAGDSVFDPSVVNAMMALAKLPKRTDGLLHVWQEPFPGVPYAIGADCAYGVPKGDFNAAVVLRARQGTHVATLMCDPPRPDSREGRMDQESYAKALNDLGRYYNTALIAVEGVSAGEGVLRLLESVYHYPNLYRSTSGTSTRTGWYTTQITKPRLVAAMKEALKSESFATHDMRVAKDMTNYIVLDRNGAYEQTGGRPGTHDDLMMGTMIANYVAPEAATLYESGSLLTVIPYGRR